MGKGFSSRLSSLRRGTRSCSAYSCRASNSSHLKSLMVRCRSARPKGACPSHEPEPEVAILVLVEPMRLCYIEGSRIPLV